MTLRIPAKMFIHLWSYDFYDMTLSTGKQRRHMIKNDNTNVYIDSTSSNLARKKYINVVIKIK